MDQIHRGGVLHVHHGRHCCRPLSPKNRGCRNTRERKTPRNEQAKVSVDARSTDWISIEVPDDVHTGARHPAKKIVNKLVRSVDPVWSVRWRGVLKILCIRFCPTAEIVRGKQAEMGHPDKNNQQRTTTTTTTRAYNRSEDIGPWWKQTTPP